MNMAEKDKIQSVSREDFLAEAKAVEKARRELKQVERIAKRLQRQIDRTSIDE